jgi:hypothetical protein
MRLRRHLRRNGTRALGLVALAALALAATSAALADGNTTVTLLDGPPGCAVGATAGEIDLGTWKWTGDADGYVLQAGTESGHVEVAVTSGLKDGESCVVEAEFSDLTGQDDPAHVIPAAWLIVTSSNGAGSNPFTIHSGNTLLVEARFDPALIDSPAPDVYRGIVVLSNYVAGG